jgi:hypothetical protein
MLPSRHVDSPNLGVPVLSTEGRLQRVPRGLKAVKGVVAIRPRALKEWLYDGLPVPSPLILKAFNIWQFAAPGSENSDWGTKKHLPSRGFGMDANNGSPEF